MRRLGRLGILALVGVLAVAPAKGARNPRGFSPGARGSAVAAATCDLGRLSGADAAIETRALARARARFERSLTGVTAIARTSAGAGFVTDLAAYLYGYPIVIVRRTVLALPRNVIVASATLADPHTRSVVAPNHDTLYAVARIDLSTGPIVIQTPPTGGRYSVVQLTDAFTNVTAYLGAGAAGATGETAVVVPPGYSSPLPAGLPVVRPASSLVWLLVRTLATGGSDATGAVRVLEGYSATPLGAYLAGQRRPPLILSVFPPEAPVTAPTGPAFFDELGSDLAADPAPAQDACALRMFAGAGIGAGLTPSTTLAGRSGQALAAAAGAGKGVLDAIAQGVRHERSLLIDGWATTPADTGRFGRDYLDRAVIAAIGLGANTHAQALYLTDERDSTGRPMSGTHAYRVQFRAGHLPPVSAFWSLTLYNRHTLFYPNRLNRYSLGERRAGVQRGSSRGLTIIISHRAPPASELAEWLPAPAGPFSLYLRLYGPRTAALRGSWQPPAVVRLRGSS